MQLQALIGKKIYQKQGFLQDGTRVPLTGVLVSGNFVTQIKTFEKEGYNALQIGIGEKKPSKRELGVSKKAGLEKTPRFFKEIRVDNTEGVSLGTELNIAEVFAPGDKIDVTGTSKGKGWAGGVKRHNFKGGPRTHGQSDRERAPGSLGQTTTPGRVYKGKRMAGRMGSETVTVKNLEVIEVTNDGMLLVRGLVPGSLNSILTVKKVGENKKFVPLYKEIVDEPKTEPEQVVEAETKQKVEENSKEETVLPTDSSVSESEENKVEAQPTVSSSESEEVVEVQKEKEEEVNKEVKEDAKS